MVDRSSAAPSAEPDPAGGGQRIVHLRLEQRLGPVEIADRLGMPASTVHAVLVRCRINRLAHVDRRHRRADPPLRARPPGAT